MLNMIKRSNKKEFKAFTLAEVLITLGIIGIVAAMTMPVLIQKNRANVVETRLQKFYSIINQSITLAELDYGNKADWVSVDTQDFFDKYLKNYLKYLKIEKVADIGTLCCIPFFQSLMRFDFRNLSWLVSMEFRNSPV